MRISRRWWLATVGCVILLIAAEVAIAMPLPAEPHPTIVPTTAVAVPVPHTTDTATLPVRLKIPALSIDAPVTAVGLTKTGDMQAPSGAHDTAWYKYGSYPGNSGTAVIAGHYGRWQNGDNSVFDPLNRLKMGDKLYVQDINGSTWSFTVRTSRLLRRDDNARSVFTSPDTKAHLNLITCQGTWNDTAQTFTDRLVVFADLDQK